MMVIMVELGEELRKTKKRVNSKEKTAKTVPQIKWCGGIKRKLPTPYR